MLGFGRNEPTIALTLNPLVKRWIEDVLKLVAVHEIVDCNECESKSDNETNANESNAIANARYDVGCS